MKLTSQRWVPFYLLLVLLRVGLLSHLRADEPPIVRMLVPGFEVRELPVRLSNVNSLRFAPDGQLTVSLTVDPVNAEAVKAQKADKDWLDIYHLDIKSNELTQLVRIDGE